MKLAILGPLNRGYEEIKLIKEGKKAFDLVSYFPIPRLIIESGENEFAITYKKKNLLDYEVVLPRIPRAYRTFGFTILTLLKHAGKKLPIDPMSIFLSHNKFLTLVCLKEHHLPVPETYLSLKRSVVENLLDSVGYPVVLKLLYGSRGAGVMFADSKESAITIIDAMERFREPTLVEKYIENPGEDVRAYVIGYEVVASMKRIAKKDRRANIGVGGEGVKYELSERERKLAIEAAKALKMEICGVDFIQSPRGPMLIETNVNAQFHGLERATRLNIAKRIIEYCKKIHEEHRS